MTSSDPKLERLHDLLADRATQGLSPDETSEVKTLLDVFQDVQDGELEYAAACVDRVFDYRFGDVSHAVLSDSLRAKLEADAVGWMARSKALSFRASPARETTIAVERDASRTRPMRFRTTVPWLIAAASLLLAVVIAISGRSGVMTDAVDPAMDRKALLFGASDVVQLAWAQAGVRGDVVWSNERQEGYLTINGLDVNDPTATQYQLWIFDGNRANFNAVDGGVFDVPSSDAPLVIAIDAKLEVFEPTLFAVTSEPPGGVVKHDPELDPERFKILLTAPVDA